MFDFAAEGFGGLEEVTDYDLKITHEGETKIIEHGGDADADTVDGDGDGDGEDGGVDSTATKKVRVYSWCLSTEHSVAPTYATLSQLSLASLPFTQKKWSMMIQTFYTNHSTLNLMLTTPSGDPSLRTSH